MIKTKSGFTRPLLSAALLLGMTATAPAARATTFTLDLTGAVSNFAGWVTPSGGRIYDQHLLPLSGLSAANAFTVAQGDEIDSTVTLDQAYTIPASQLFTAIVQVYQGTFDPSGTATHATFNFYDNGTLVGTYAGGTLTTGQIGGGFSLAPPHNGALTFDSFTSSTIIDTLAAPATVNSALLEYSLVSQAVPEPASWAMLVLGLGLAGATMRRKPVVRALPAA